MHSTQYRPLKECVLLSFSLIIEKILSALLIRIKCQTSSVLLIQMSFLFKHQVSLFKHQVSLLFKHQVSFLFIEQSFVY